MIIERKELMSTIAELEQNNAAMRAAIESRGGCCDGGKCHAPPALNLPEGYAGCTLTPAEPVPEAVFEDVVPVAGMDPEQLEAAWAGVKQRQRELHERLRDPYAADPLERRVVGDASALPAAAEPARQPAADAGMLVIKSPMVGTFYKASGPDAAAFVKVGDRIGPEKTVCIVEAMKVFNEIPAGVSGQVVAILVENGAPVEFGQPLIKVDPGA
jgi:acetyl-CoA carboxylase biotin carboxyl carrier protein